MLGFFNRDQLFAPRENGRIPALVLRNRKTEACAFNLPATLGRNPDEVDMYIFDPSVSRVHVRFEVYQGRLIVTDLGSTVGTKINGVRLQTGVPFFLDDNSRLTIGKVKFKAYVNTFMIQRMEMMIQNDDEDTGELTADADNASEEDEDNMTRTLFTDVPKETAASETIVSQPVIEDDDILVISDFEIMEDETAAEPSEPEEVEEEEPSEEEQFDVEAESEQEIEAEVEVEPEEVEADEEAESEESPEDDDIRTEVLVDEDEQDIEKMQLRWINPDNKKGDIIIIEWTPYVIGRTRKDTDHAINARGISHRHFFIDCTGEDFYITDLNSTNGVKINGKKIKPMSRKLISEGDIIGVGEREYRFEHS